MHREACSHPPAEQEGSPTIRPARKGAVNKHVNGTLITHRREVKIVVHVLGHAEQLCLSNHNDGTMFLQTLPS